MVTDIASSHDVKTKDTGPAHTGARQVAGVPVRNLWLLTLYASELFRMRGVDSVALEESPHELPDLIAEILAHAVEQRQRRRFSLGYLSRHAVIHRIRGRVDMLKTERRQLLARGQVACCFEELTIDTPRNRFVRAALDRVSRLAKRPDVAQRCRKLASDMKAMGVAGTPPTPAEMRAERLAASPQVV